MNQTSFDQTLSPELQAQAVLAVKDHYTFDFLELSEEHSERELEQSMVQNLRRFLAETGGAFTFVGNQYRLEAGGQEYFIDLLLFHRRLRCLVAIELKIGAFRLSIKVKWNSIWNFWIHGNAWKEKTPRLVSSSTAKRTKPLWNMPFVPRTAPSALPPIQLYRSSRNHYRNELPSQEAVAERLRLWDLEKDAQGFPENKRGGGNIVDNAGKKLEEKSGRK